MIFFSWFSILISWRDGRPIGSSISHNVSAVVPNHWTRRHPFKSAAANDCSIITGSQISYGNAWRVLAKSASPLSIQIRRRFVAAN